MPWLKKLCYNEKQICKRENLLANKIITVNRKKYAVGLFWQPVGAGYSGRNYARVLSKSVNKKYNLYVEYRSMIGLGAGRFGHRVAMRVAAAEIMESLSEYTSFLAVFQVDKGFYLVAARNGIVLQDELFNFEEDARSQYVRLSEIPVWGAFFAPASWGMPRAVDSDINSVLGGPSHVMLHSISRFGAGMISAGLVVLFALALSSIFFDSVKQTVAPRPQGVDLDPELVAEYKRQIEEKNKELDKQFDIQKILPPEPIVMPYELLPDVSARAQQCYQGIAFVMQPVTGWVQTSAECNETHVIATLRRTFGTLDDFYNVASELMPGAFVQEINEDTILVQAKLPSVQTNASVDERDVQTIVRDVTSAFQSIDSDADTEIVFDTITNGVDTATVGLVEVAAESKLIPTQFMQVFGDFGGVYLIKCSWDATRRFWNYEVIIYAK